MAVGSPLISIDPTAEAAVAYLEEERAVETAPINQQHKDQVAHLNAEQLLGCAPP